MAKIAKSIVETGFVIDLDVSYLHSSFVKEQSKTEVSKLLYLAVKYVAFLP
jgi:hypothetical protein